LASSSLTVANIHAGYGAVRVLEDVSLNVAVLIALQAEAKAIVFDFVKPLGRRGHNFTRGRQAKLKSKHAAKIISAGYCESKEARTRPGHSAVTHHARWLLAPFEIRPDIGAALAASGADKERLYIREADIIRPLIAVDRD
jgi:hypothetical protein